MDDRRLNKYISDSGYCSRREADRLIALGQVTIDGRAAAVGERVASGAVVRVGRQVISGKDDRVYLAVHKPVGIVSTADPREPLNIVSFLHYPGRVFPVGRLDKDSEGLILMTSDGDIVNRILRAEGKHEKEYEVTVDKPVTPEFLQAMCAGVPILGQVTLPCTARKAGPNVLRIVLTQGLNRQIRRMCEYLGYEVVRLKRLRVMNITLGAMRPGEWRPLRDTELKELMRTLDFGVNREGAQSKGG